ncbi:MAG TPA: PD-(D/E)XK nuclease-like domain-containing protein [Yeosuana sp.]
MTLKLGLNEYMSNTEYHADRSCLSSSGLRSINKNEYDFRRSFMSPHEEDLDNAAFSFGTYIHTKLLEPHLIKHTTAIYMGKMRRGKEWEQFKLDNPGKNIVTKAEFIIGEKISINLNKMPKTKALLAQGRSEETYCSVIDKVKCKVRFDKIGKGYGLDVKTTSSPTDAKNIIQTIEQWNYELPAAFYVDVANKAGADIKDFYFLFANKKSCELVLVKIGPDILEKGRDQYKAALKKYNELKNTGFFDNIMPVLEVVESSETLEKI